MVQRYNILYVSRFNFDTGGLIYPRALNQLFTGLYGLEIYLIGLFFLVRDEDNRVSCVGQGVIMIFLTFLTATYQVFLNQAFGSLSQHLPIMLDKQTGLANHSAEEDKSPSNRQHSSRKDCTLFNSSVTDKERSSADIQDEVLRASQPTSYLAPER